MQHEMDHLNGILFIDHVAMQSKELFKYTGMDDKGEPQFEKILLTDKAPAKNRSIIYMAIDFYREQTLGQRILYNLAESLATPISAELRPEQFGFVTIKPLLNPRCRR